MKRTETGERRTERTSAANGERRPATTNCLGRAEPARQSLAAVVPPFAVRRSPFADLRSPISVLRSPFSARRSRIGFTLLELLVVLVLFAITAAAAVPALMSDSLTTPEQRTATELAAVLARTRSAARETGAPAAMVMSPSDGRYWITTRDSTLAGVIAIPGTVTLIGARADRVTCRFSPTGAATPLVMTVHGARDIAVRVDGWSGDVVIGDARGS